MRVALDHLIVLASTLDEGRQRVTERLGVPPVGGGRHARMGTHNLLWSLGAAYLEVIAVDPEAPPPGRDRWLGFDDAAVQTKLGLGPYLATWAVATDDIEALRAKAPVPHTQPRPFFRDDLTWLVALPEGTALPLGGIWPLCIQWTSETHPTQKLEDQKLRLDKIEIMGPAADRVQAVLATLESPAPVIFLHGTKRVRITADIYTPQGLVRL